jgi:branched-chain amino acid transport system substrate-binding protein
MMRFFSSLVSISLALVSPVLGQEPVSIGVYLPLTGNLGYSGQSIWEGIRVAHKMCPQVVNRPVAIKVADTKSDRSEAVNAVLRLTEKEQVAALIGERALARATVGSSQAGRREVPVVTPSTTSLLAMQGNSNPFSACGTDLDQATLPVKFALRHLGARTAAIICDIAQEDSISLAASFKNEFAREGGRIVSEMRLRTGDRDFIGQISKIRKTKPEVIYAPVYHIECALIARQARDMGLDVPIIVGDGAQVPKLMERGCEAFENLIFTCYSQEETFRTEMGEKFRSTFESETGKEPLDGHFRGAEAYFLILDAIRRCGSLDPGEIRESLSGATSFGGVTGTIAIHKDGQAPRPICVNQVKLGKPARMPTENLLSEAKNSAIKGKVAP